MGWKGDLRAYLDAKNVNDDVEDIAYKALLVLERAEAYIKKTTPEAKTTAGILGDSLEHLAAITS